jgi:hypothetical protein
LLRLRSTQHRMYEAYMRMHWNPSFILFSLQSPFLNAQSIKSQMLMCFNRLELRLCHMYVDLSLLSHWMDLKNKNKNHHVWLNIYSRNFLFSSRYVPRLSLSEWESTKLVFFLHPSQYICSNRINNGFFLVLTDGDHFRWKKSKQHDFFSYVYILRLFLFL